MTPRSRRKSAPALWASRSRCDPSLANQPPGLAVTRFSGGEYVLVDCLGDTSAEAAEGVGQAIGMLMDWIPAHGYVEGDACFAASRASAPTPPWVETVYIKLERAS